MSPAKVIVSTPLSMEQHKELLELAGAKGKSKAKFLRDLIPFKKSKAKRP